jgi:hypothetical protein
MDARSTEPRAFQRDQPLEEQRLAVAGGGVEAIRGRIPPGDCLDHFRQQWPSLVDYSIHMFAGFHLLNL